MKFTFALLTAVLLAPFAATHPADAPAKRPNVLVIITDQLFADAMSCRMGKAFINTPVMDGLTQKGTLFTRAYSANPLCAPARKSLFTCVDLLPTILDIAGLDIPKDCPDAASCRSCAGGLKSRAC